MCSVKASIRAARTLLCLQAAKNPRRFHPFPDKRSASAFPKSLEMIGSLTALLIRSPAQLNNCKPTCMPVTSKSFSEIYVSGCRAVRLMGILELQRARWPFSRARPKCGRSLSFNREGRTCGRWRKDSPQSSHPGGTNSNRCYRATCAARTPGRKIYRYKRGRSHPFDHTDDTTA